MPDAAIITGDIVNFTLLPAGMAKKMIAQMINVLHPYKAEFYRGDSFQAYIKDPAIALELVFRLRAVARSFQASCDIRASIGIGKVNTPVRTLRTANSPAFILSGRTFDELNGEQRLLIRSQNSKANIGFNIIAYFADFIFQRLTVKQAEVVLQLLENRTQMQAAKKLKKAQATINQLAQSAGWVEIEKLIAEYKQVIVQFNIV
jgi:hypothetical protein